MSKPDWCPQDVWEDTGMEFDKLYDAEPDLEGGCEQSIREVLARGVVKAYSRGLEDAARVADAYAASGIGKAPARNIAWDIRALGRN